MEQKDYAQMSNEALLLEKKKLKQSKIFFAAAIGFLAGVFVFGIVGWILSPKKNLGFFIPMIIPILLIRGIIKKGKENQALETILKERGI
ncbi:MAG: hypothetical protein K2Y12_11800 [Chitinophagaceae bacterium]|nr:hypothetical protein [Chitinophagaceae bacterium]